MTDPYDVTPRNRVRQLKDKAAYDRDVVHAILDAALVAHVGFVQDGVPVVVPMIYGRDGETLFLHGARKARVIRLLEQTKQACVNVTLVDALVLARSAFNSSLNYRSVTLFGRPLLVEDRDAKLHALHTISEHTMPGRWAELREPLEKEIKMTGVIGLAIESASAKVAAASNRRPRSATCNGGACSGRFDKAVALEKEGRGGFEVETPLYRNGWQHGMDGECRDAAKQAPCNPHCELPVFEISYALPARMIGKDVHRGILPLVLKPWVASECGRILGRELRSL